MFGADLIIMAVMSRSKLLPPQKPREEPPATPAPSGILDNRENGKVGEFLREKITPGAEVRVVSAYFSIYAHQALRAELESAGTFRFLFGDPRSAGNVIPGEPVKILVTSGGRPELVVAPDEDIAATLQRKRVARECEEWVNSGRSKVQIQTLKGEFLHGKMFHIQPPDGAPSAVCGSSNFTARGLGFNNGNRELNIVANPETCADLKKWFQNLWEKPGADKRLKEGKRKMLEALQRLGKDQPPEVVYYLTLYRLFRDELEKDPQSADDLPLEESAVWGALYPFQKSAVYGVVKRLRRHGFCVLADSVGLGKTYTALAVVRHFRNERILVLCPKRLKENWTRFLYDARGRNPLRDDHFRYRVRAHTDLSREDPGVDWNCYDLVVIDESHNFRNHAGARYKTLRAALKKSRAKTLMLSATPVNISLTDMRNQILLAADDDAFSRDLGIPSVRSAVDASQKSFAMWEKKSAGDKDALMEGMGVAFLKLMDALTIARSRRHVQTYYAESAALNFPDPVPAQNLQPETDSGSGTNPYDKLSYADIHGEIGGLSLALYSPSKHLRKDSGAMRELREEKEKTNFNQQDREHFLIGMMRVNLLKRLESSVFSFRLTLNRTIDKIREVEEKIDGFRKKFSGDSVEVEVADILDEESEDEDFFVGRRRRYDLAEMDLDEWGEKLKGDREKLEAMLEKAERVTADRDAKLDQLKALLREKAQNPLNGRDDGLPNRKALVFTSFADTADYLYDSLRPLARELGLRIGLVKGSGANKTTAARASFDEDASAPYGEILDRFAPRARRFEIPEGGEIDLLIATDCVSEGQNLQDCDWVVNYDIHWNPVRIVQRFGRIDRIGSRNKKIKMTNFWPPLKLEEYLALRHRVDARMALADIVGAGGLTDAENQVREELRFRDAQLRKMIDEGKTLTSDDLGEVSASDFTMADFLAELRAFLEANREALENAPNGLFAVVESDSAAAAEPGVIFCLKRTDEKGGKNDDELRRANRTHPYFLVYVRQDGGAASVRFGFPQAKRILRIFGDLCRGKFGESSKADKIARWRELCAAFDAEIQSEEGMEQIRDALNAAVNGITGGLRDKTRSELSASRSAKISKAAEQPKEAADFELVSWLVVR